MDDSEHRQAFLFEQTSPIWQELVDFHVRSIFKGRRELFTGLAVEQLEQKWEEYPVLHLDLNAEKYDSPFSTSWFHFIHP